jgi:hypothetical protein
MALKEKWPDVLQGAISLGALLHIMRNDFPVKEGSLQAPRSMTTKRRVRWRVQVKKSIANALYALNFNL